MLVRLLKGLALLSTGLLAGAFAYGAVNVVPAFTAVPLDVRLTFHAALMTVNPPVMQTAMALAMLSSLALAAAVRSASRLLAAAASTLVLTSLLVTLFGNAPLHGQIKDWAATSAPAGHAAILQRWELFNNVRTVTAVAAFLLVVVVVDRTRHHLPTPRREKAPAPASAKLHA